MDHQLLDTTEKPVRHQPIRWWRAALLGGIPTIVTMTVFKEIINNLPDNSPFLFLLRQDYITYLVVPIVMFPMVTAIAWATWKSNNWKGLLHVALVAIIGTVIIVSGIWILNKLGLGNLSRIRSVDILLMVITYIATIVITLIVRAIIPKNRTAH